MQITAEVTQIYELFKYAIARSNEVPYVHEQE